MGVARLLPALPVILLWGVNRSDEEAQPIRPAGARP